MGKNIGEHIANMKNMVYNNIGGTKMLETLKKTKIYAVIEKDEGNAIPVLESEVFLTKAEAESTFQDKVKELCNIDGDYPIDESELISLDFICKGAIEVIDARIEENNLITLYLVSIALN